MYHWSEKGRESAISDAHLSFQGSVFYPLFAVVMWSGATGAHDVSNVTQNRSLVDVWGIELPSPDLIRTATIL